MKRYVFIGLLIVTLTGVITVQRRQINAVTADRDAYKQNTYTLLSDVERYSVADSLQAVSIRELHLTLGEYEQYRQGDMKLIKSLEADKNRLQQIIATQTVTDYVFEGSLDTLNCVDISEKWFDLHGCIDDDNKFTGRFESRDSLLYVEHIVPKRFWFIKWGVKERRQEIVSRNPHTRIAGADFVTVRK